MLPALGSRAYHLFVRLAALAGHEKAREWVAGRMVIPDRLEEIRANRRPNQKLLWLHAASLGEFEQGMPVLEMVRKKQPDVFLVLTFFSPSGYLARKDYATADAVLYLPEDKQSSAVNWLDALQPDLAIFVKYEFWPAHLEELRRRGIPTLLIAGAFRPQQPFFKWYGWDWRRLLQAFTKLVVQTPEDAALLTTIEKGNTEVIVAGDPRMDRVLSLAECAFKDELLEQFVGERKCLLAGSVWSPDVDILAALAEKLPADWCLIMAPHRIKADEIKKWTDALSAVRYSESSIAGIDGSTKVMIMDTTGILSRAYRYADLAYVGGAFGRGLHNTLEPMAYGLPVIFGPNYDKFTEAVEMVNQGGCFSVTDARTLYAVFQDLAKDDTDSRAVIDKYVNRSKGATLRTYQALRPYLG